MIKYIKFAIREFLGLENDYESILNNQQEILQELQELKKMEIENQELILEEEKESYYDYLTLKNLIALLILLGIIGGGFWLYNIDFFNNNTLESMKSLTSTNANTIKLAKEEIIKAVQEGNTVNFENAANVKKAVEKVTDLLLKKGIDENTSPALDTPVSEMSGNIEWGDFKD